MTERHLDSVPPHHRRKVTIIELTPRSHEASAWPGRRPVKPNMPLPPTPYHQHYAPDL